MHFAASLRTLKVSTATSKNEIATMNQHPDTKIPISMLRAVGAWMVQVVKKHKISDRALDEEEATPLLRGLLGDGVTFGILRGLDGGAVLNELWDELKIKLPRNMEAVFAGFARGWSPNTPICPACKVPAIRPLADRTGVETLPEGSVCPWCAKETVCVVEFSGSLRSWVTGAHLPLDTEFDDIAVRGTRLPLQEKALRDQTRTDLLASLDRQDVLVHDWLRYLLVSGYQVFSLPRAPLPILASLDNDAVMQYGTLIVDAQILAAKRTTERVAAGHALDCLRYHCHEDHSTEGRRGDVDGVMKRLAEAFTLDSSYASLPTVEERATAFVKIALEHGLLVDTQVHQQPPDTIPPAPPADPGVP